MTMTPDERARQLAVRLLGRAMNSPGTIDLIAAAIREAENETLERAAAKVEEQDEITGVEFKVNGKPVVGDDGCSDFVSIDRLNAAIVKKAAAIRALKSKD